eukprot:247559-Amphidinium_carterae.1
MDVILVYCVLKLVKGKYEQLSDVTSHVDHIAVSGNTLKMPYYTHSAHVSAHDSISTRRTNCDQSQPKVVSEISGSND